MKQLVLAMAVGLWACGDDSSGTDAGTDSGPDVGGDTAVPDSGSGAIAHFDPSPDAALAFDDVPFPSDLFLDESGHVDIAALPSSRPLWIAAPDLFRVREGFCSSCAIFFPIDGELDPTSVPDDAAIDSAASITDSIFLVDVTDGTVGDAIPLLVEYGRGRVVVRPVRGVVLTAGRTYAAGLRTSLLGADGSALQASPTFARVRDGDDSDPAAARALAVMDVALDSLDRDTLAVATVFRVDDGFDDLRETATAVGAGSAPVAAASAQLWSTPEELDQLFGIPSEDAVLATDVEPIEGEAGSRAIAHASVELVVGGSFDAPLVIEGDGSIPGLPLRDADGAVVVGETVEIPFLVSIPSGVDVTNLPVIVFHPGFGDHMQWGLLAGELAARAGAAVITFEPLFRGERGPSAVDENHWLRGAPDLGSDGLFEHSSTDVISRERGIIDVPDGMLGFPGYRYGTLLQNVADLLSVIRLVKDGDWSALESEDARLAGLSFDTDSIHLFGGFYGGAVGVGAMAVDDTFASAYLYAVPGAWIEVDTESPVGRAGLAIVRNTLGVRGGFDDVTRRHSFDPLLELYRWAIEPTDPTVLGRRLYVDTELVNRPHLLVHLARLDEWVGPPTSESFLAAAQIPGFGAFEFADVATAASPIEANVNGRTVGAIMYEAGHFAIVARTDTATIEPPIEPPFVEIDPPQSFAQPFDALITSLQAFYVDAVAGRAPRLAAP